MTIAEEDDEGESLESRTLRSSSPLQQQQRQQSVDEPPPPIDLNGSFRVVDNHNFGEFLRIQGVPWFLCKAASKARPTHTFHLSTYSKLTIQIKGIIESETDYTIGGPYTETSIRGRVFRDTVRYLYDGGGETENNNTNNSNTDNRCCVGLKTIKVTVGEGYSVHVLRRVIPAGTTWVPPEGYHKYDLDVPFQRDRLLMMSKIVYDDNNDGGKNSDPSTKEGVMATQLFHKEGR